MDSLTFYKADYLSNENHIYRQSKTDKQSADDPHFAYIHDKHIDDLKKFEKNHWFVMVEIQVERILDIQYYFYRWRWRHILNLIDEFYDKIYAYGKEFDKTKVKCPECNNMFRLDYILFHRDLSHPRK